MTEFLAPTRFTGARSPITVGGSKGTGKTLLVLASEAKAGGAMPDSSLLRFGDDGLAHLNSVTGQIYLLVTDALTGIDAAARREVVIAHTAGFRHLAVAVSKMDLAGWSEAAYKAASDTLATLRTKFDFASVSIIPVSAAFEETLTSPAIRMPWYAGPSLLPYLAELSLKIETGVVADAGHEPQLARQFSAHVACIGDEPLLPGRDYTLKLASQSSTASIASVKCRMNPETLHREPRKFLAKGEIGICTISAAAPLAIKVSADMADAGRFVLADLYSGAVVAAGTIDFALRRGSNIHLQSLAVAKGRRAALKSQRPCILWFTGLSGSGKSTIANAVERELADLGFHTYLLDGDNVRHGLNKDLGFTAADRVENIRRVGEVAKLFVDAGTIVLCSFISPFRAERAVVRGLVEAGEFIEVYVGTPLDVCEARDTKGLYAKARAGQLPNFTGIDSPYEPPERADMVVDTTTVKPDESARGVVALLRDRGILARAE